MISLEYFVIKKLHLQKLCPIFGVQFIYAVLFAAENLFRDGLKVGNRYLPVVSMSEELMGTDNDGGRLTLTFQYYDAREKEETAEIMKVLHQRYQGKET